MNRQYYLWAKIWLDDFQYFQKVDKKEFNNFTKFIGKYQVGHFDKACEIYIKKYENYIKEKLKEN